MIYFFVLTLLLCLAPLDRPGLRDAYIMTAFLVLLMFLGARWETGTDWGSYIEYFQDLDNYRSFEPGFVLENKMVRLFTNNYTLFLFINGALALAPIAWLMRKESRGSMALGCTLFYAYYYLITYFGSNRRIIAIGLCVLAAMQLLKKRDKLALSLVLAGACFHYSAILCVLYYPLARFRASIRGALGFVTIIVAAIGLIYALLPFLLSIDFFAHIFIRVGEYLVGDTSVEGYDRSTRSALSIAKRLIVIFFIIYSVVKNKQKINSHDVFFANSYVFSFIIYLLSEFVLGDIFKTFTIYFSIYEIVLIPNLIRTYEPRLRFLLYSLFVLYVILQTYSATFGNPFVDLYLPYRLSPDLKWLEG